MHMINPSMWAQELLHSGGLPNMSRYPSDLDVQQTRQDPHYGSGEPVVSYKKVTYTTEGQMISVSLKNSTYR